MRKKTKRKIQWALGATGFFLGLALLISFGDGAFAPAHRPRAVQMLSVPVREAPLPPAKPDTGNEPDAPIPAPLPEISTQSIPPVPAQELAKPEAQIQPTLPRPTKGETRIVLVIDDMGVNPSLSARAMRLPAAVGLSFLPYAHDLARLCENAKDMGHGVLLHMPMQPLGHEDPGPDAIRAEDGENQNLARLEKALAKGSFEGVNNHMGSLVTARSDVMRPVMRLLREKKVYFLDSMTSPRSVAGQIAREEGLPTASRDVFLDDDNAPEAIRAELGRLEKKAKEKGVAIAIGHPRAATLVELEKWIPAAEARGIKLVPLREMVGAGDHSAAP